MHRYSGTIQGRPAEGGVPEEAWDSTLGMGEGVGEGVDCSKFESMQGSTLLGMLRDMSEAAVEGEVEGEVGAAGEYSS